jgi:hypothetical protein
MALQWGSEWQQCYVEALLETDAVNLAARVEIAERVMTIAAITSSSVDAELPISSDRAQCVQRSKVWKVKFS